MCRIVTIRRSLTRPMVWAAIVKGCNDRAILRDSVIPARMLRNIALAAIPARRMVRAAILRNVAPIDWMPRGMVRACAFFLFCVMPAASRRPIPHCNVHAQWPLQKTVHLRQPLNFGRMHASDGARALPDPHLENLSPSSACERCPYSGPAAHGPYIASPVFSGLLRPSPVLSCSLLSCTTSPQSKKPANSLQSPPKNNG